MKKKFFIITIFSILFLNISFIYANSIENNIEYSEEYLEYLKLSDEEKSKIEVIPRQEFVSYDDFYSSEKNQVNLIEDGVTLKSSTLPTKYKLSDSIGMSVENQGQAGWCWAYTSLKSAETNYALHGNGVINLAEYHLAYMRLSQFGGWLNLTNTAGSTLGETAFSTGGNFDDFAKYCGFYDYSKDNKYGEVSQYHLMGPIEGEDSQNKVYDINLTNKNSFTSKKPKIKVTKIVRFPNINKTYDNYGKVATVKNGSKQLTNDEIQQHRKTMKEHIIQNGSLYASINIDDNYFNSETNALYVCNTSIQGNHAVSIIGWDDNYSKENFKSGKRPANNGAWIAQNSWGRQWGNYGCFYISYDDLLVETQNDGVVSTKLYNTAPSVVVQKSNYSVNDGGVMVYLVADEPILKLPSGWSVHESSYTDKKTIYKKLYTKNTNESFVIRGLQGDRTLSNMVNVNVNEVPEITLNKTDHTFNNSDKLELTVEIPTYRYESINWSTTNSNVSKVDSNGIVTPVGNGTCQIVASTTIKSGTAKGVKLTAKCNIVVSRASSISLSKTSYTFSNGDALQLTATVLPSQLENKEVIWNSSNENIAKVSSDGKVKPGSVNGSCRITATTTDGTNLIATCNITVNRVTGINLDKSSYTFSSKNTLKLTPTIIPSQASKEVNWSSSNEKVAKVDSNGIVTPVGSGECNIYAVTLDKGLLAKCSVTVLSTFNDVLKGDINQDGRVNINDVNYGLRSFSKGTLTDKEKNIGNVNGDTVFNINDINKLLRFLVGKISTLD